MLMAMPLSIKASVNAWLVSWLARSVLTTSGLLLFARASSSTSMQKAASIVIDGRQAKTRQTNQSDNANQIGWPPRHRDLSDIYLRNPVGVVERQITRQIGVNLVTRRRLGCVGRAVDCFYAHVLHHRWKAPAADLNTLAAQQIAQHSIASIWVIQMEIVQATNYPQVPRRNRSGW